MMIYKYRMEQLIKKQSSFRQWNKISVYNDLTFSFNVDILIAVSSIILKNTFVLAVLHPSKKKNRRYYDNNILMAY